MRFHIALPPLFWISVTAEEKKFYFGLRYKKGAVDSKPIFL